MRQVICLTCAVLALALLIAGCAFDKLRIAVDNGKLSRPDVPAPIPSNVNN